MTETNRRRLEDIFTSALELEDEERRAYLDRECGVGSELRAQVERLLQADGHEDSLVDVTPLDALDARWSSQARRPMPEKIGTYAITGVLGRGGMGIVYEAVQQHPRRKVALKVLQASDATDQARQRFSRESEFLARLEHPGIARVIESGEFEADGALHCFHAMELVHGCQLLEFAQADGLSLRDRVSLLARICDAVQHAHQKGVLHRDLKPANVLVTPEGQPKVIDFGIGRIFDVQAHLEAEPSAAERTHPGVLMGTLAYMSPEQADGDFDRVDTRTDVYALGVVGYELLSGRLPIDVSGRPLTEAVRTIREAAPRALRDLGPALSGDVETILQTAMAKDPERRFASAAALAEDLRRYLGDEPILARPATALYRARKFVARNRGLTLGLAAALLAVLIGSFLSVRWALRADRAAERAIAAKKRADAESEMNAQVVGYVERMFADALPRVANGDEITARQLLDAGRGKLIEGFPVDTWVGARIRAFVGRIAVSLGDYDRGSELLDSAIPTLERVDGAEHPRLLSAMLARAQIASRKRDASVARELLQELLVRLGEGRPGTFEILSRCHASFGFLARVEEEYPSAEKSFRAALAFDAKLPPDGARRAQMLAGLASSLTLQDRLEESAETLQQAQAAAGDAAPKLLRSRLATQLGNLYIRQQDRRAAGRSFRRALELAEAAVDADHPVLVQLLVNYASVLAMIGRTDRAEKLLVRAKKICDDVEGVPPEAHAQALQNLANCYATRKEVESAMKLWNAALAIQVEIAGEDSHAAASIYASMAWGHAQNGDLEKARELKARADTIRGR